MNVWKRGGEEYPFDISEASCIQRLAEALNAMKNEPEGSAADCVERYCRAIADFFDVVFGNGAGERICGGVMSGRAYSEAYLDFIDFVQEQIDALVRLRAETEERYVRRWERILETEGR